MITEDDLSSLHGGEDKKITHAMCMTVIQNKRAHYR